VPFSHPIHQAQPGYCWVLPRRRKLSAKSLQEPGQRKLDRDVRLALKMCQDLAISLEKVVLGKPETPRVSTQLPQERAVKPHRIIELLRLEKTLKIIESNHNLTILP